MRLLFVIDCLGSGGAQRQIVNLAVALTARQHQIEFFVYYPAYTHFRDQLQRAGIVVHGYQKRGAADWRPILRLRMCLQQGGYDLALAFLPTPSFYLELAALGLKLPLVVSERSTFMQQRPRMSEWLLLQAHRLADQITVNSYNQYTKMIRQFPWMRSRLQVIYNGVDLHNFQPDAWAAPRTASSCHLLALGSVVYNKNAHGLIAGLAAFRQMYPDDRDRVFVTWVGKLGADQAAQTAFDQAQALLAAHGISHMWQWLGERSDVADLLRRADALIHPAFFEGLPNVVCEALASGLPVLASAVGDHAQLVAPGVRGFLFDPAAPETIATAIQQFCGLSMYERTLMGQQARCFAEEHLALEQAVTAYEQLFLRLVHSSSASASFA